MNTINITFVKQDCWPKNKQSETTDVSQLVVEASEREILDKSSWIYCIAAVAWTLGW